MSKAIVYFTPDQTDSNTGNRAEAFLAEGCRLLVLGFRRGRYNGDFLPSWPSIALGRTRDGHYMMRLIACLGALPVLIRSLKLLAGADVFYARNIDLLLLALLARGLIGKPIPIVYEILDVQPAFVGSGAAARVFRAIERFGLRRIRLLVLTSPGFLHHYFRPVQGYAGPWFLLENKLSPALAKSRGDLARPAAAAPRQYRSGYRWVVGYCGLIRGRQTFDLIARVAERLRGQVLFKFHGVFTTLEQRHFEKTLQRIDNLIYEGPFRNPQDLARLYGEVDFAWAIDLEHAEHNSRWLRPCRFYEAGYFGVPCLAASGFETGTLVDELQVGWSFAAPFEQALVDFFRNLTDAEYQARRQRLLALPIGRFVIEGDAAKLLQMLAAPPPAADIAPEILAAD
ncbi:MAG TPA: hypothetical protein VF194_08435 [Ferrovibrio sp.]|uniref:hypothetical protein n=1 Tax=Ferrovibrio sp. TaxID=1917215 RepID=UPI002ED470BC